MEIATEGAGEGTGEIESEAGILGSGLEGAKEPVGMGDARTVVGDLHDDARTLRGGGDEEVAGGGYLRENADAVGGEVEEDLDEICAICPDEREMRIDGPLAVDIVLAEGRGDDDFEIVEDGCEIDLGGLLGVGAKVDGGDAFEGDDEIGESFEVLVAEEDVGASEVLVDDGDGTTNVSDFVGDSADGDAGACEHLMEAGFFAGTKLLRCVEDHGGEAWTGVGGIGGEADVGEESFAAFAMSAGLHDGAEEMLLGFATGDV